MADLLVERLVGEAEGLEGGGGRGDGGAVVALLEELRVALLEALEEGVEPLVLVRLEGAVAPGPAHEAAALEQAKIAEEKKAQQNSSSLTPAEKKVRNLKKKIKQLDPLKAKRAAGEALTEAQEAKLAGEPKLVEELAALEATL